MPTDPRPAFIAELVVKYGEPRVKVDAEAVVHTELGQVFRRCWVWFLPVDGRLSNHNVSIDRHRNGRWELSIGCHCSCRNLTIEGKSEPTDDEARELLAMAGWPVPVAAEVTA